MISAKLHQEGNVQGKCKILNGAHMVFQSVIWRRNIMWERYVECQQNCIWRKHSRKLSNIRMAFIDLQIRSVILRKISIHKYKYVRVQVYNISKIRPKNIFTWNRTKFNNWVLCVAMCQNLTKKKYWFLELSFQKLLI